MTTPQSWVLGNTAVELDACSRELHQLLVQHAVDPQLADRITYHVAGVLRLAMQYGNPRDPTNNASLQVWVNKQAVRLAIRGPGLKANGPDSTVEDFHRISSLLSTMLFLTTMFKHVNHDKTGGLNLVYVAKTDP